MWKNLRDELKDYYNQYDASHDMAHIERVYQNALRLMDAYPEANKMLITFAVGMHDIEDKKYKNDQAAAYMDELFTKFDINSDDQKKIREIIDQVSFSGGQTATTLEAQIVQDADRLDALGAVGIARTFSFGGSRDRALYNHAEVERVNAGQKVENGSSVTHFYEKLLLLKELMNTSEARKMAEQRHLFMEQFLDQLYEEIGERPCLSSL